MSATRWEFPLEVIGNESLATAHISSPCDAAEDGLDDDMPCTATSVTFLGSDATAEHSLELQSAPPLLDMVLASSETAAIAAARAGAVVSQGASLVAPLSISIFAVLRTSASRPLAPLGLEPTALQLEGLPMRSHDNSSARTRLGERWL